MPDIIPSPTPYLCADIPEGALPTFLEQYRGHYPRTCVKTSFWQ